jgi:hypothetical protein
MGFVRHHSIVVTSTNEQLLEKAQIRAKQIFDQSFNCDTSLVSSIVGSESYGCFSFFIAPDGSKEGWEDSDRGDSARQLFISWVNSNDDDEGFNELSYVEVFYGDDDNGVPLSKVVSCN